MTTPSPLPTPSSSPATVSPVPTTTIGPPPLPPPSTATPLPQPDSAPSPLSEPNGSSSNPPNSSAQSPPMAIPSAPPTTTPSSLPPQPPPRSPTPLPSQPLPQTSPPSVPYRPPPPTPPSGSPTGSPPLPPTPPLSSPPLPLAPSSQPPQISPPSPESELPGNLPPPSVPPPQSPVFLPPPPSDPPAGSPPPPLKPPVSNPPPPPPPLRSPPPPRLTPSSPLERPENSPPPAPALVPPTPEPSAYTPPPPPDTITPSNAPPPPRQIPSGPAPQSTPLVPSTQPSSYPPPPQLILLAPPPPFHFSGRRSNIPSMNNSSPNAPESSGSLDSNGLGTGALVSIGAALGIATLSFIVLLVWCLRRRRKQLSGVSNNHVMPSSMRSSPASDSTFLKIPLSESLYGTSSRSDVYLLSEPGGLSHSKELFTYEELVKATNDFASQNLLGEGGFGCVYKGLLPDGRKVAVKQLKMGGGQGDREFKAEVQTISRIHHRYLVSLVGYCISENRRLLIYEYVPNNNLYFHLHAEGKPGLDWGKRFKVAAGAARGVAYLHEDCHPRIIHRDIKSSNILLDENFDARVSDFGLAKLALDADTHITTRVMGTFGYMAPEYASSGKLTEKSDVFSFGVVLLELITGRKPVDTSQPLGDESLVEWARPLLSHALETEQFEAVADPRLGGNYVPAQMFRMIEAAAACVRHSAAKRPQMGQVQRAFDSLTEEDLTNGMKFGESEIFKSAQQSAEIRLFQRMAFGSQNYSTDFFTHSSWKSSEENV